MTRSTGSEFGRGNQSHGRRTPHKVGMVGVVAIPKRQQIAMPLDHDGLPPAAFARLSRQHEAAWHDFMPGAWQRFVGCGWVVRRLLNQHGRRQFRIGVAADMRQETRGRWRAADRVEWLASARQASGSKLGRAARSWPPPPWPAARRAWPRTGRPEVWRIRRRRKRCMPWPTASTSLVCDWSYWVSVEREKARRAL
jgi:hypothetical protein